MTAVTVSRTTQVQHALLTAGLGPLLLLQGLYVRRVTPQLPEAAGPRTGETGNGPLLRLLILGDSAAAGVGAATQAEALSGQLATALATDHRVQWTLFAGSGWDTAAFLDALGALPAEPVDYIVTSLGVNDVTGNRSPAGWMRLQVRLVGVLRERFEPRHVFLTGVPPMQVFPALPQPLRWYLGRSATRLNRALDLWAGRQEHCSFVAPFLGLQGMEFMASDGFHPGPRAYTAWAERMAAMIRTVAGPAAQV